MHKIIGEISSHEGNTVAVTFDRFLLWVIYGFNSKSLMKFTFSEYENEWYMTLFGKLAQATNAAITAKGGDSATADVLSALYEKHIIATGEKSRNAQYHTPDGVSALCAELVSQKEGCNKIYEPCCGSGHLLLAAWEKLPGTPVIGEELDPVSARMTVVNLLLNGIEGDVICRDVLMRDKPRFAYRVNAGLRNPASIWFGTPHIEQLA